jgi:hypothetical protein
MQPKKNCKLQIKIEKKTHVSVPQIGLAGIIQVAAQVDLIDAPSHQLAN